MGHRHSALQMSTLMDEGDMVLSDGADTLAAHVMGFISARCLYPERNKYTK
jgi:hypothetical protein